MSAEVKTGYKQTEVGVIPEEWDVADFDTLGSVIDGDRGTNYPSSEDFSNSGHCLFLNAGNVTKEGFKFTDCAFITQERDARLNKGKLERNDIVLTTRGTVGNLAHFDTAVPFENIRINSGMVILRNTSPSVDNTFLYTLLQSRLIQNQIERLSFGSAQPQLTVKGISKFGIVVPALPEQRAIAGALSDVDALIGVLGKLIDKKRDLKQAAMQQLLTGKQRLPGFSGKWELLSMAEKSTLKARIGWQGLTTAEYLPTGEYYLVTGTDFVGGRVNWSTCCFVDASRYVKDKNIQLKPRDILLTKDGTIGKVAFVDALPRPATLNSGVFVICPKGDAYDPLFFYYILTSRVFEDFLAQLQAGSTISHLYQKDFINFRFRAPSLPEQTAIAAVLSDMDAEIAALEQRRDKTKAIKQGMIQELLTGKTRLV